MFKIIFLLLIVPIAFLGCERNKNQDKTDFFDKCLAQANQTYTKEDTFQKSYYVRACMAEKGYKWSEISTGEICPQVFLNSNCYR